MKNITENPRLGVWEGAPPKWWPDFKEPDFSEKEQFEIERYCKKILENVSAEKGMTPWERWKITRDFGIPDRPLTHTHCDPVSVSRVLDCWSHSLKPGFDMYNYPELFVKANIGWVARFNIDFPFIYSIWGAISMLEWGGSSKVRLSAATMPVSIDPAVKTEADWDRIHVPDVHHDGLLPVGLWSIRKIKEFMNKYEVSKVMPLMSWIETTVHPGSFVLMGIRGGLMALKRRPDLAHKADELLTKFNVAYQKASLEAGADVVMSAGELGVAGLEKGKEFNKYFLQEVKQVGPNLIYGDSGMGEISLEYRAETGSYGTGWYTSENIPWDLQRRVADKYKKCFGIQPFAIPALTRSASEIIDATKRCIDTAKGPGFWTSTNTDYFSLQENLDAYVKTVREYGREVYKGLR